MKIHADLDRCEGLGVCAAVAPEVYEVNDDDVVAFKFTGDEVPAGLEASAEAGSRVCPLSALDVVK